MAQPLLSVIVTTFQRPNHLRRALASLAMQTNVRDQFEVIIVDDGSQDDTYDVVVQARRSYDYPLVFLTHEHNGFHPARSRNEGIATALAPYLIFLDGDCVVPQDHLSSYLEFQRPSEALAGDGYWLDLETSQRITITSILRGDPLPQPTVEQSRAVLKRHRRFLRDAWLRKLRMRRVLEKPGLKGVNFGAWRRDCEKINGFDENYRGWGCEDDDFGARLRQSGIRITSIMHHTPVFHLWHAPSPSTPRRWKDIVNRDYFLRKDRALRCDNGLVKSA
jgi:glycosyltransferase involved in cell wall biosynthesis